MDLKYSCKNFEALSSKELYAILKLRQDVFIIEQDCIYPDLDEIDFQAHHFFSLNEKDELLGYLRLIPPGEIYPDYSSIGRVVSSKKARGQGIGKSIMQKAILKSKELYPNHYIKLSAQTYVIPFYQSLGFEEVGDAYLEDNIPHKSMVCKHS